MTKPFYIADLDGLRDKLARAERDGAPMGRVWAALRRRTRAAPEAFPWFTPFVALATGEERDLEAARRAIRNYVATFALTPYTMGLQFHFWCFAFPHARWTLYFQWLDALGAWTPEEGRRLREELIRFQFVNFFSGMRTKPEPECVDNQTMSLCYSNALVGHLFSGGDQPSTLARRMRGEGVRRLPDMLGGMPPSGYSGEGSTYMDHVVGPCVPLLVEFLEQAEGGDWFARELPPAGGSAETIVRMIAREWTPTGLTLPWDHYGYSLPVRSCIAYGAYKTGESFYHELLEKHAGWTHDVSIGWGYDDLVWSLVWWPARRPAGKAVAFPSWAADDVGAALVSDDSRLYLMQMWDHTNPGYPTRAHVNPNALVLCADGSPLTVDGVADKECTAFNFDDTWKEISGLDFTPRRTNFGAGCGGAHGIVLVDGWEGMRAQTHYEQARLVAFDPVGKSVTADVTPLYRERWPDARRVRRRSRLCEERFWLIEDLAVFEAEHRFTARWYLRPHEIAVERGVAIETAEGVRLRLVPLVGPDVKTVTRLAGYPDRLDGESLRVDFEQAGRTARWLWLAWTESTRAVALDLADGWQVVADPGADWEVGTARPALNASALRLPLTMPAFMLAEVPVVRRWWYRRTFQRPAQGPAWLRLPRGMIAPRLWVDGVEIDLTSHLLRMDLLAPQVELPASRKAGGSGETEVVLRVDCGISQYGKDDRGGSGFSGAPALLTLGAGEPLEDAAYRDGTVTVRSGQREWHVRHDMMEAAT